MAGIAVAAALALAAPASAETYFGFRIGTAHAPPPPEIRYVTMPNLIRVTNSRVFMIADDSTGFDGFRCGSSWYVYANGYWYRSDSYRGPFRVIEVRKVPRSVLFVPPSRWKHHPHVRPARPVQAKHAAAGPPTRGAKR